MTREDLKPGDRIRVEGHWNWPDDCSGVVAIPPSAAQRLGGAASGHIRTVPGRTGPISFVWIVFDEPQMDGDGAGPYRSGEVEIELVTRAPA